MSAETLLFQSLLFAGVSALLIAGLLVHRSLRPDDVTEKLLLRHAGKSPLSPRYMVKMGAVALSAFLIVLFTSDPAYTWLSSIALMAFFAATAIDRIAVHHMVIRERRTGEDDDGTIPEPVSGDERNSVIGSDATMLESGDGEPIAPNVLNIVFLLADIVIVTAFIDLLVLVGVEFAEIVLPHYIGMVLR